MLGKVLTITKNSAIVSVNKETVSGIKDLINLHVVFEDSDIVDKLCTSFITERIKYDHKSELDYVIDDEAKFLVASIDSYYSKNKEV